MAKFSNEMGITEIHMKIKNVKMFCPIGKAWYTGNYNIIFVPDQTIPDYIEIQEWIDENLTSQSFTIEYSCSKLRDYLNTYNPHYVKVDCNVTDAAHFEVTVMTEA